MDMIVEQGIDLLKTDHRRKKQAHNNHHICLVDHVVFDDLPENCIFDILVRLPLETLCSSRFVRKSWFEIINSPYFRNAHLHRSDTTPRGLIFMIPVKKYSSPVFSVESNSMLVDPKTTFRMKFLETKDGKSTMYNTAFKGEIVAACNGLIVLKRYPKRGLILLNPVTRELGDIPLGTESSLPVDLYGLAFCHVSRRYKLLHLFTKDNLRNNLMCEIMDIGSGSWRAVDVPPTGRRFFWLRNPVLAMGALHWTQYVVDHGDECMVSMPLDDEKYKTMEIPVKNHSYFKSVFAMGEFLGFAGQLQGACSHQVGVWILSGECGGWKKQYNFDISSGLRYRLSTLTLLNYCGGEFVFKCEDGCVYAYDRCSLLMREIDKRAANFFRRKSFPHTNSLVSWRS